MEDKAEPLTKEEFENPEIERMMWARGAHNQTLVLKTSNSINEQLTRVRLQKVQIATKK